MQCNYCLFNLGKNLKRKMFEKDKNKLFDQLSGVQVKIFNRKGLIILKVTLVIIQSHRAQNRSRNDLFD